jgi:hypothetical protein
MFEGLLQPMHPLVILVRVCVWPISTGRPVDLNRQACVRNEVTDAPREINEFSLTL